MELRGYQTEAVEAIEEKLGSYRATLLVMATGTGKTQTFLEVARRFVGRGGRVLVLAHREELVYQARDRAMEAFGLHAAVEMAAESPDPLFLPDLVSASVQTMVRRMRRYDPQAFDLVIVDEAHHATASTYRSILDYFTAAKVLGVTATPKRADRIGLKTVFESVAYIYRIRDAIKDGWVTPISQQVVHVEGLDLSSVRTQRGDYVASDLEEVLTREQVLHELVSPLVELAGDRPTLVFCATVHQAYEVANMIERYIPGRAVALDGTTPRQVRADVLADFEAGCLQYIVNVGLFTEGYDAPRAACVAMARPTQSTALYLQAIGRGLRLHPDKRDLLVLDFVGNAHKHKIRPITAKDALAGKSLDDEARQKVERMEEKHPDLPLSEIMELVREEARKEKLRVRAQYRVQEVSPFGWEGRPVTEAQVRLLKKHGVEDPERFTRGEASQVIDQIMAAGRPRANQDAHAV